MKKNILIIGGSYFVGKVFVEEAVKKDLYAIHVLNRGNRPLNIEGVREIVCDRYDFQQLEEVIPHLIWDAVVDFCAYAPTDIELLMDVLPQNGLKHYIYISTASVYRETLELPVKEDAPKLTGPQPELGPAADYGYNKWLAEVKLAELCRDGDIPYTSLRPAIIYGKYNYAPRESYFFDLINKDEMIVLPDNELALFQFVSVWDVARIIMECIGNEKVFDKAFNLAAEELVCYRRFVQVLEQITEKKIATKTLPIKTIDQQRIPLPFPLDKHLIYSGTLIQRVLGFEYMSFVEGMKRTYEWYVSEGNAQPNIGGTSYENV